MATINGTNSNDTLDGNNDADTINGNAGADTITGGSGNDKVSGGAGKDIINLGAGDDYWIIKDDEVVLNAAYGWWGASGIFDTAEGGLGTDTIWIQSGDRNTRVDLSKASISGFESLLVATPDANNYQRAVRLNDAQIRQLESLEGRYGYYNSNSETFSAHQSSIDGYFNESVISGNISDNYSVQFYLTDDF